MLNLRQIDTDVLLPVIVQPRSSRNTVIGLQQGAIKIALTAPPIDGAANAACLRFLADLLGLSRARLATAKGKTGRLKLIRVTDATAQEIQACLQGFLPDR